MKDRKNLIVVPKVPQEFKVERQTLKDVDVYIKFVKNISSRIRVFKLGDDKTLSLKEIENKVKTFFECSKNLENIYIHGWPNEEDVAFILCIDSSLDGNPCWEIVHLFIFCFGNFSFGIEHTFTQVEGFMKKEDKHMFECSFKKYKHMFEYSFEEDPREEAYTWRDSVRIIKVYLESIEEKVLNHVPSIPRPREN